jgi:tripartite-type tricarboxylate transporter receptor subunit TctC
VLGAEAVSRAEPDGLTWLLISSTFTMSPAIMKLPFDPVRSFVPIAMLGLGHSVIAVPQSLPFQTIKDLVDYAKANPGKYTFGSTGNGTTPHLAVEEFAMKAGIQLQHIPFKGNADGMASLLGGHVMSHSDATGWAPHVDAGTCRLLATYGSKRTKRWPNVPTLTELGYDTVSDSPFGIGGPKGMDPAVTRKLHDAFKKTLEDPQVLATFEKFDQSVIYMNSEDYAKFARDNYQKEKVIIEKLGLAKPA